MATHDVGHVLAFQDVVAPTEFIDTVGTDTVEVPTSRVYMARLPVKDPIPPSVSQCRPGEFMLLLD